MRRWIATWLVLAAATFATGAALPAAVPPPAIALNPATPELWLHRQPQAVVPRSSFSVADAIAGRLVARLAPGDGNVVPLSGVNELWMPLRVRNMSPRPATWELQLSPSAIDEVTLYETQGATWVEWVSGDRVPMSLWPHAGRFPRFDVRLEAGETRTLFVRVRNAVPSTVVPRLVDQTEAEHAEQRANIGIGVLLGALALLVLACFLQAALYADTSYFLYGAYALLLGLAFATLSGIAGEFVWGDWTAWNDSSKAVFPLSAAGVSVWLARELCRVRTRGRTLARVSGAVGMGIVAVGAPLAVLGAPVQWVMAVCMSSAAVTVLFIAVWTWRRGDAMGGWVLAAHAPLIGVTLLVVMRMFGVALFEFDSSVLLSVAIGAILPLLLMAVHLRSREFLAVQVRARELTSIDPLTGLLARGPFADRVRAAVRRWRRSRHDAAVIYLRVTNYTRIHDTHGSAAAEQTMIRTAMRLQRLVPDADCMGRVNENTIGLIVETVTDRAGLMERASRLVAHGLMPVPDLKPEINLNFQVVMALLSDTPQDAGKLQEALENSLAAVSARTRRPIRFLEDAPSGPVPADGNAEADSDRVGIPA